MSERPDDTEANEAIRTAATFSSALCEIVEKYDIPITNNTEHWQDGVYLRELPDFMEDIRDAALKFKDEL